MNTSTTNKEFDIGDRVIITHTGKFYNCVGSIYPNDGKYPNISQLCYKVRIFKNKHGHIMKKETFAIIHPHWLTKA